MTRTKQIPDADILYTVRLRLLQGGSKSASFAAIAAATGLSAPALVLRFGTQPNMCRAAILAGWDDLQTLLKSSADLGASTKDIQGLLKSMSDRVDIAALLVHSQNDPATLAAATAWRTNVEGVLTGHFGGGLKGRAAAGLVFAAWQGRMAWTGAGGKSFRLGEIIRNLT